ncbi:hypothetical protein PM082_004534 [Marasmius tenuissimus]|nr:hypothetical protein PM082_004534 [Marasmius tenuissimus]
MVSEQEVAKQVLEPYTSSGQVIVFTISTLSVMLLVYGMYIIIFGLSVNVLWFRHESSASKSYMRWIIALFILTTISNATIVWFHMYQALIIFNVIKTNNYVPYFRLLSGGNRPSEWVAQLCLGLFSSAIISFIFDYLMVHRCYVIWGYSKRILYPFIFVVLVTNVAAFVVYVIQTVAYKHQNHALYTSSINIANVLTIIAAVYTSLLTLLTAGRIWWTVRQVEQLNGKRVYTRYKIFVATILESGLLSSATLVISVILPLLTDPNNKGLIPFDFNVVAIQMAAIAPTLIIIRIAYGQAVESVQQMVSTLQFAEGASNSQQPSTAAHGTIYPQQSLAGVEERCTLGRMETSDKPPSDVTEEAVRGTA